MSKSKAIQYTFPALTGWAYMILDQIQRLFWNINVVIPYHLTKSLQAITLSFISILIGLWLELDSNWNTMQQVRTNTKYIIGHFVPNAKKRTWKL